MADIRDLVGGLDLNPAASKEGIRACQESLSGTLPADYVDFLRIGNGGDGFVGKKAYVILWECGDLSRMNNAYEVMKYAPGLVLFGSNGGGEGFGFDTREADLPIVEVPFVGMDWRYARECGRSFMEFLEWLRKSECAVNGRGDVNRQGRRGQEILEITPVIVGGSPTDPANKTVLTREQHIQAVVYWNRVIKRVREQG